MRMPTATPNASAAAETSPIICSLPASGARATGSESSARLSPTAARSAKRGMRTQTIIDRTHVRIRPGRSERSPNLCLTL